MNILYKLLQTFYIKIAIEDMDISLKYDIIISLEILEHVPNVLLVLKKCLNC